MGFEPTSSPELQSGRVGHCATRPIMANPLTDADLATALAVLEASRELAPDDPRYLQLEWAAAHLRKTAKRKRRLQRKHETTQHDRTLRASEREQPVATRRSWSCYVCKQPYRVLHPAFPSLCGPCAEASLARRGQRVDLRGRTALVTGGRIKIGYAVALELLRSGARVRITTRFPGDAARRYAAEPDAADWLPNLEIHGLDFRKLSLVLQAIEGWRDGTLDILINNAAQTVWHPPAYYRQLVAREDDAPLPVVRWNEAEALVPLAADLERTHSWVAELEDVAPVEVVECQVVNAIVPFLLCSRLQPAMLRSTFPDRYVVNVTAVEGQFDRAHKLARHPHTNMAKAALNMLTRTSAAAWAEQGIHMNAVDPGWVSHEGPPAAVERAEALGFQPPLTVADAAARVLDPVVRGVSGDPIAGVLLKDFTVVPW